MEREQNAIVEAAKGRITVVEKHHDYSNDPFFLKKEEEAYKALTECPIPEWLLKRMEKPQ